jgi:hypothetical protein
MKKTSLFLALIITLIAYNLPVLAQINPPDDAPQTTRGNGSRSDCPFLASGITLTPLIPESSWGYTKMKTPTIWVNIHYTNNPQNFLFGELSLLDKSGDLVQERIPISIPNHSGIFPINLPELPSSNYRYHWVLEINCDDNTYADVQGYIYQQEIPDFTNLNLPERMSFYQQEYFWYDALNEAINIYCQDSSYLPELLRQENLESIVTETLTCPR